MWNLLPIAVGNLLQRPQLDRLFYVPFWECPYECPNCCVDSLPGRPPDDVEHAVPALLELLDGLAARKGEPIQMHVYGGEPLLRPDALVSLARQLRERASFKRLYVYSTLRGHGIDRVIEAVGADRIRVIVNPQTATDLVRRDVERLRGIAEWYANVTVFPTGRGRVGSPAYERSLLERLVPASMPGRSCFATVSGPLVNAPHRTVHLCCLPQSPVVGTLDDSASIVIARYEAALASHHRHVLERMRATGASHACSVCEEESRWSTGTPPRVDRLVSLRPRQDRS